MKPNTQTDNFVSANSLGSAKMSIDASSTAHIINLLTDLYSDKALAVIREYSTNALDANVEAGNPNPIHVTRPNRSNFTFSVRDEGVGLSRQEIEEVYSMYGASTKRDTNEAVGMLGLGCKSGLTYAPQFTVEAVKDGMRTIATVGKGEDGVGEIQILLHEGTIDTNGVTISIPVPERDLRSFNDKIDTFFGYWRDGVLIDGEPPRSITDNEHWTEIDPDVYVCANSYGDHMIVQGNVAYPVARSHDDSNQIVAYVPIGSVDFTPSREDLHYTDKTKDVVSTLKSFVTNVMIQSFRDELAAATDDWNKLKVFQKWRNILPPSAGGRAATVLRELDRFKKFSWTTRTHGWVVRVHRSGWKKKGNGPWSLERRKINSFPIDEASPRRNEKAYFVRNFSPSSFSNNHYERLLAAGLIDEDVETFYTIPPSYGKRVAVGSFPGVDWEKVPQLPRKPRPKGAPRKKTEYMMYSGGTRSGDMEGVTGIADISDPDKTVYRVVDNRTRAIQDPGGMAHYLNNDILSIILITPRQEERFLRLFPGIKNYDLWVLDDRQRVRDLLTDEIKSIYYRDKCFENFTSSWRDYADQITNGHFLSFLDDRTVDKDVAEELSQHGLAPTRFAASYPEHSDYAMVQAENARAGRFEAEMEENYPLITNITSPSLYGKSLEYIAHVIEYINSHVPDWWEEDPADPDDAN